MTCKTFRKFSKEAYNSYKTKPTSKFQKNKNDFLQLIKSLSMELKKGSIQETKLGNKKLINSRKVL